MDRLDELQAALSGPPTASDTPVRPDLGREAHTGIPEVILGGSKTTDHLITAVSAFLESRKRAIITRATVEQRLAVTEHFSHAEIELYGDGRTVIVRLPGGERPTRGGVVGIMAAGTSDVPVAEEAATIAREMGCDVQTAYDVGVAGIHRLFGPLRSMLAAPVDAMVVAAGMDGALPSVVAGLVDVPVIGLPVSVGYGLGGQGIGALITMLQTCAPGLTVVNVDNGVGAGATAGLIARRAALARGNIRPG